MSMCSSQFTQRTWDLRDRQAYTSRSDNAGLRSNFAAVRHICRPHATRPERLHRNISASIREQGTGVEFPEVTNFWQGDRYRCLGTGNRQKKIAFVGVKIYAVALFVEAEKAARELGIRDRGGFFKDAPDEDYTTAILDGTFDKMLQVQLVRTIEGSQFYEALEKHLAPRLRLTGGTDALQKFGDFINGQALEKGTDVLMLWTGSDRLEVVVKPSKSADYSKVSADLKLQSVPLVRGLFEVFLGSESVVPGAKKSWAQGTRLLLESERVQKDTRPGAFG